MEEKEEKEEVRGRREVGFRRNRRKCGKMKYERSKALQTDRQVQVQEDEGRVR